MNTTVRFIKSFKDIAAKGQELFVRRQGHAESLPFKDFTFDFYCTREMHVFGCVSEKIDRTMVWREL